MFFRKTTQKNLIWYEEKIMVDAPTLEKAIQYLSTLLYYENFFLVKLNKNELDNVIQMNNFIVYYWNYSKEKIISFSLQKANNNWSIIPITGENIEIINQKVVSGEYNIFKVRK